MPYAPSGSSLSLLTSSKELRWSNKVYIMIKEGKAMNKAILLDVFISNFKLTTVEQWSSRRVQHQPAKKQEK